MPKVGDKEFPYTDEGMRQANILSNRTGQKVIYTENKGKFGYQEGGSTGFGDRIRSTVNPVTGNKYRRDTLSSRNERVLEELYNEYKDSNRSLWDRFLEQEDRNRRAKYQNSGVPMPPRQGKLYPGDEYMEPVENGIEGYQEGGEAEGSWMQENMPYGRRPSDWEAFKRSISEEYPDENPYWGFTKEVGRGMAPNIPPEGKLDYGRMKRGIRDIFNIPEPESTSPDSGWVPVDPNEDPRLQQMPYQENPYNKVPGIWADAGFEESARMQEGGEVDARRPRNFGSLLSR